MRPLLIIVTIILALFLVKTFYLDKEESSDSSTAVDSAKASPVDNRLSVDVFIAKKVSKSNTVYSSGTIIPNEEVELKSEVAGRIISLNLKEGGYVKKGQLIAKINDDDLVAQLKKLKYEEELASQTEARHKKLLEINAISKEEYDLAVNKVNTLSADKEFLAVQMEKTSVRAPFSGRMGFKNISEGAYITPGTIITNIVQTNPAKIEFSLPEKYSNKVKVGQNIAFSIDGSDDLMNGKVIAIDPKIDNNLRTLGVRGQASNKDGKLLPGMFVRVEVPLGNEESIMIPSQSIVPILKGKKVYLFINGKAQERIIKTGLRTDTNVQVEDGLEVGDSVIVSSLMSVKNNSSVKIRNMME